MQRLPFLAAFSCLTAAPVVAQSSVVIPVGFASTPGNSANYYPWGTSASGWNGLRLLATYGAVNFTGQNITAPILIDRLQWRPDDQAPAVSGGTFTVATVEMSTSPVGWRAVTTNIAADHGPDRAVVYSGPVVYAPTTGGISWTPQSRCVDVTLTSPFLYDPLAGDLVIDVYYPSWSFVGGTLGGLDVVDSTPSASRVYGTSSYPGGNGTTLHHGLVVEVDYVPGVGLHAGFTADVTGGNSPLSVNFTDHSHTSSPGGVTSWLWDFDNDGTVDSTLQNPTHTFTACGAYDVSLTVIDGVHPNDTKLRAAYIVTDAVAADFDDHVIASLVIQFTDMTTGPATSWAWDLDGDGTVDTTLRNPAWPYPTSDPVDVTLTASRLCGTADTITRTIRPVQMLSASFIGLGVTGAQGWVMLFDVDVTAPLGLAISAFSVNAIAPANSPLALDIYQASDSYLGNEADPGAWQLVSQATGTISGYGQPTLATLARPVYLPPGSHGLAMQFIGGGPAVMDSRGNQIFANGELTLSFGAARTSSLGSPFATGSTAPRYCCDSTVWYDTFAVSGSAGYGFFGRGCPGTMGISTLLPSGDPVLGTTLTVTANHLPTSSALMVMGVSNTTSAFGALPYDLAAFGAPGCWLRVSPEMARLFTGTLNRADWVLGIPNNGHLFGVQLYQQAAVFDPGANAAGAVGSSAHGLILGR
ncbi:MAG: PKD domain-containing protein [Planctomycetes bacterium]|nr:PKD domain-containing protein [Planctomycetota bacterium]